MSEAKEIDKDDEEEDTKKETKKASKGQKKKDKLKKKKTAGEGQSVLAKIAAAKSAKHKEEEEKRRKEDEDRENELERERIREAEEKKKHDEEEQIRVQKEREKYQEEKRLGLRLTPKQIIDREKMENRRKELLESVPAKKEDGKESKEAKAEAEGPKTKSFVVHKKKKGKKEKEKEGKDGSAEPNKAVPEAGKAEEKKDAEESKEEEDWEKLLDNPDKIKEIVKHKLSRDQAEDLEKKEDLERKKSEEDSKTGKYKDEDEKGIEFVEGPKGELAELRSPILCVLGHVDTGKTKLLDKIRNTRVQEGEVGGITQQIGATFFPAETLAEHAAKMKGEIEILLRIPGLLIIDTPGHESFSNLRNRGSSLCDFAILVVDIMHGLENQTIESINILKKKKIPFVVALNKIDRCYGWKPEPFESSKKSYERNPDCHSQFETLTNKVIAQFAEQEINACLYWNNIEPETFSSLVPTSAITGEGIPDMLTYVSKHIQTTLNTRILNSTKLVCTVMEVKVVEGYGVTCDVILVTGELRVDDVIVVSGFEGAIVTTIRALLTPQPLREMRVKGEFIHHKAVRGTMGVKLCAPGLEEALAGSPVYKATSPEDVERLKKEAGEELANILKKFLSKIGEGIYVQSSTLGSLEAMLELLKANKVPVAAIGLGPIFKRHIMKALKAAEKKTDKEEYATILAFEVEPDKEAKEYAEKNGIRIITEKTVYHLIDAYKKLAEECVSKRKADKGKGAVFPCLVKIIDQNAIFNSKEPIVIGVNVLAGVLKVGTPLCIPDKENLHIGNVESLEINHKPVNSVRPKDGSVAVKITGQAHIMVGRHFDVTNQICSLVTRDSIDALKMFYKDEVTQDDIDLLVKLKAFFKIP